jgi:transaldolase
MKFFIDTADIGEIRNAHEMGVLDGVTTNPSLIAKTGRKFRDVLDDITKIVDGPISAEVVSLEADAMIKEGKELAKIHKNIVVKIPMTLDGLKATKALSGEGIPVNVTLIFSAAQGLLAAKAGAAYASPFVGRIDDTGHEGMHLIAELVQIYENYDFATEILVASCRSPLHVIDSAKMGAHVATIPYSVIEQLVKHPLTDIGLKKFLSDWEKVPKL